MRMSCYISFRLHPTKVTAMISRDSFEQCARLRRRIEADNRDLRLPASIELLQCAFELILNIGVIAIAEKINKFRGCGESSLHSIERVGFSRIGNTLNGI